MYDGPEWATCYEQVLKLRFDDPEDANSMGTAQNGVLGLGMAGADGT